MKRLGILSLVCLLVMGLAGMAQAVLIDFESVALGTYNSLTVGDVTFTAPPGSLQVVNASPGAPISGHCLISFFDGADPIVATFAVVTRAVKVGVGDFNADVDNTYLEAYDAANNLLDVDYYQNPAPLNGGDYLRVVSSTPIAYVIMRDVEPFPMAVYWDNFEYTPCPAPIPGSLLLLGSGMLGLMGIGVRRKSD